MSDQTIEWLRSLAAKGGKGVVDNIDARCLGRIADELEALRGVAATPLKPEYLRGVLTNNIERANDIVWDLQNKPEFDKSDPSVLGVMAVAEQMVVSLTALLVDLDNAPEAPAVAPKEYDWLLSSIIALDALARGGKLSNENVLEITKATLARVPTVSRPAPEAPAAMTLTVWPSSGTFLGYRDANGNEMHCRHITCPHEIDCRKGCSCPTAVPRPHRQEGP